MAILVPAGEAEAARARLLELVPEGFEEREAAGALELVAYTDSAGEERLRAAFARVSVLPVEPGWEQRWRAFHRPVRAGGLWIGPPWVEPPAGVPRIVVDPGRAFGTGAHPTTRACLELLARLPRGSLLDAGCGSGVLAAAAARLGFAPVYAIDSDQVAVAAARQTARRNRLPVEVRQADVLRDALPAIDALVANIELRTIEALLPRVAARVAITAGYLADEAPAVPGWRRVERLELEGWAADTLVPG